MMKLKNLGVASALVASSVFAVPAMAEVSGNLGVASQYIFRGVAFGDPQVSGGVDWAENGLYAGAWISSANGEQEVDLYGGWANDLLDVGYLYYYFPDGQATQDTAELYAGVASGPFAAKLWYALGGESNIDDDESFYVEASVDVGLTDKASLSLHVGMKELTGKAFDGLSDTSFMDYAVTVSFGDLFIMASAIDYVNPLSSSGQEKNDPTITVGYSWSFDDIM